jgi:hypothetical protein
MGYIYAMEYSSAINKNGIAFGGKCMELEIIMLNEISQAQKYKHCMFSLICRIQNKNYNMVVKGGLLEGESEDGGRAKDRVTR